MYTENPKLNNEFKSEIPLQFQANNSVKASNHNLPGNIHVLNQNLVNPPQTHLPKPFVVPNAGQETGFA